MLPVSAGNADLADRCGHKFSLIFLSKMHLLLSYCPFLLLSVRPMYNVKINPCGTREHHEPHSKRAQRRASVVSSPLMRARVIHEGVCTAFDAMRLLETLEPVSKIWGLDVAGSRDLKGP